MALGNLELLIIVGIFALLFLPAVVALAAWLLVRKMSPGNMPERIVKARYARGEISREEYLKIMEDLTRSSSKSE